MSSFIPELPRGRRVGSAFIRYPSYSSLSNSAYSQPNSSYEPEEPMIGTAAATLGAAGIGAITGLIGNRSKSRADAAALAAQQQSQQQALQFANTQEANRREEFFSRQALENQRYQEQQQRLAPYRALSASIIRRRMGGGNIGAIMGA